MLQIKHIAVHLSVLIGFGLILSWCQSDIDADPISIKESLQYQINSGRETINKAIENFDQTQNEGRLPGRNLEDSELSYFVFDHDSLVFWQGETIRYTTQDEWIYDTKSETLHFNFDSNNYHIFASIHTQNLISTSVHGDIHDFKDINSIVKPKSRLQLTGFSALLLLLCFIICYWNFQFKLSTENNALVYGSFFALSGILLFFTFSDLIFELPSVIRTLTWLLAGLLFLSGSLTIPKSLRFSRRSSLIYSILTGSLIAFFNIITQSYLKANTLLDYQKLDFYSGEQFLFGIGGILMLFGIWIIFRHAFSGQKEQLTIKIYKVLLLISSYLIIGYLGAIQLPFPLVVLFLVVYYLTADLFFEIKEQNATWLIWWIILNASFFASNLYFISIQKEITQSLVSLKDFYKQVNDERLSQQNDIIHSIQATDFFSNIKSLPPNAKLSSSDIKVFLNEVGIPSIKESEIFYFHLDGSSGLLGRDINKDQFDTHISIYDQVALNIMFDHLSGRYLLSFEQLANFYILSESKDSDPKLDFGVFNKGEFIYGNLDELPEFIKAYPESEVILTRNAITHIAYKPNKNIIIYSRKNHDSLLKPISIFSLIFCLAIFSLFIISLLNNRFGNKSNLPLFFRQNNSLRLRIQIIIIFLILLSFISIALITSLYFKNILRNSSEKQMTAKVVALNNSFQSELRKVYDIQSAQNIIENEIPRLNKIHNSDIAFYGLDGKHYNSENKILPYYPYSTFILERDLSPITRINTKGEIEAYFPLNTANQGVLGFIKLENNHSSGASVDPLSDFLGTILNLYVFLFLIAGAIAIAVSRSITRPLSTLSQKFNSIKVGQKNEIINWESQDEIGKLIANYNDMVQKLDLNIELLAKTERDSAWQEMAKQVAHEIKNPLTPMKLSLQYLQRAIETHPEKAEMLIKKTAHTLLEQIENLTEIANAFSNLASLPQADNEKIILNEVVDAVHDLFRKRDDIDIQLSEPLEEIIVFADKGHLVRILNNIVKNAIQSIPQDKAGKISIKLYTAQTNAVISVEDNGDGIPKELQSKIFTPKFTTKSSGSGLGLAIAKNMIESFNGHIYFESTVDTGTTFYIEIPLMRNPLPRSGVQRVEL